MASPKKDLVRWCKGKEGVEHQAYPTLLPNRPLGQLAQCGYREKKFRCVHVLYCPVCKRILTYEWQMKREDCPDAVGDSSA